MIESRDPFDSGTSATSCTGRGLSSRQQGDLVPVQNACCRHGTAPLGALAALAGNGEVLRISLATRHLRQRSSGHQGARSTPSSTLADVQALWH